MGKIILSVFVMMSTSVMASDLEDKITKCIEKESAVIKKGVFKECGISESFLQYNNSELQVKLSEAQKNCISKNHEKFTEQYKSEIEKIVKKCTNS